jgi:hypothetical protein
MTAIVPILKDNHSQLPIPSAWRKTFFDIVEALKEGDFRIERNIPGVRQVSDQDAARIADNIKAYGAQLISLPDLTWQTSACQWMNSYWDILIDLFTAEEGASDLALAARVYEDSGAYIFEIQSVYVP